MLVPKIDDELRVEDEAVVAEVVFETPEAGVGGRTVGPKVVRVEVLDESRCVARHEGNPDLAAWASRFLSSYLREHPDAVREKLSEARGRRGPVQPTVTL
ncbi:MAG: hypothetical protein ACYDCL_01095 [Myxococcales bacterium]